jgi:hypothetical protein
MLGERRTGQEVLPLRKRVDQCDAVLSICYNSVNLMKRRDVDIFARNVSGALVLAGGFCVYG